MPTYENLKSIEEIRIIIEEIIKDKFPSVKLIHLKEQTLPGAGRDIGISEAKGKIIAFTDSDCIVNNNWLQTALESINKGYSVVGGSVKNANSQTLISIADYFLTFNEFLPTMPKREVLFMPTCNLICKKEVFEDIGGFPPHLAAGEDTIFNYKASKKYKLLFNPRIKISHNNRDSFKKFFKHHYNFGLHAALLRKKYKLPGNIFVKYPPLIVLIPFVRFFLISLRMVRWNWKMLPSFIVSSPLIFIGILIWSVGFMKNMWWS